MKWGYLIPRVLVVLLLWGFCQYGFDPTLRLAGEYGLSTVSFRQAKVGSVTTQFWPPRMEVAALEVCEDDRVDQAELAAGSIRVAFDEDAVRQRRWVAKEVVVEGLEWNVPAEFEEIEEVEEDESSSEWLNSIQEKGLEVFNRQLASLRERVEERLDPNRLETVQLAKTKREEYEATIESLKSQIEALKVQAERYKQIAENSEVRRAILLDPARFEALARDAATLRGRVEQLREEMLTVKAQVPVDYQELNLARQRDLSTIQNEWQQIKSQPDEFAELILGGPVTDALRQVAVWWPRWKKFQESGDWKEKYETERRGRDIVFLPEQAGPIAGIRHLLVSGNARSSSGVTPFKLEMGDLAYPIQEDAPAKFQWISDGGVTLQAAGLMRVHRDHPEMMVQFRLKQKTAVESVSNLKDKATVAFESGPTLLEGTLSLGKTVTGDCRFAFADAAATIRTGNDRYDAFLAALDVNAANLTPEFSFTVGEGQRDYKLRCEGLSSLNDAWKSQLTNLAREKATTLRLQAEDYLNQQLASLDINGLQVNELLGELPDIKLNNVADLRVMPQQIQQTAAEQVEKQVDRGKEKLQEKTAEEVNRFFNRFTR